MIWAGALALVAAVALPLSPSASAALTPTTTSVVAQYGGYITTYTSANGNVTRVFSAVPVTIAPTSETTSKILVGGKYVTQHTNGVKIMPNSSPAKTTSSASATAPMSAYEGLLALGADPAEIQGFKDMGTTTTTTSSTTLHGTIAPSSNTGGGTQISNPPACVDTDFDGGHGHVYGCDVTRRVGSNGSTWYLTDAVQSTGTMHDTGCVFCDHITGLKFGDIYKSGNIIQSWKPSSNYPVGGCSTDTVSLSYKGVGVSDTAQQCPETFGMYSINSTTFYTKWDGQGKGPNDGARSTHAVDGVYNCGACSYLPGVYAQWWYTST